MNDAVEKAQKANADRTAQLANRTDAEKAAVKLDSQKPSETVVSMGGMAGAQKAALDNRTPAMMARDTALANANTPEAKKRAAAEAKKRAAAAEITAQSISGLKKPDTDPRNGLATLLDGIFPNELIYNYTEPTYHLTWSMIPEKLAIYDNNITSNTDWDEVRGILEEQRGEFEYVSPTPDKDGKPKQGRFFDERIIIAESAVTADLNIQSFTIETNLAVNSDARKTIPTEFTMELFEPYGCTMFDTLYQTAIILGFEDWKKGTHHVLEIEFFGRNKNTGVYERCTFPLGGKSRWLWRFCITGINAKVDEGGTHYTLKGCPIGDMSQNKQVFQIPKTMDFPKGQKVWDFFNGHLKKQLDTFYEKARNEKVPIPRHTFSFIFENSTASKEALTLMTSLGINPDFKNWTIVDDKSTSNRAASQQGREKIGKWSEGTTFEQILQDVQCATKEMQIVITGKKTPQSEPIVDRKHILKVDFRIVSDIIPKQYDAILREYEYHYVHRIVPFVTTMHIVDEKKPKDRDLKDKKTAEHQDDRYKNIGKNKMVCKKYSHIYTGENQDLLSFNIELNLMTFSQLPKMTATYNTQDAGVIKNAAFQDAIAKVKAAGETQHKTDAEIQKMVDNEAKKGISNYYGDEYVRNSLAGKISSNIKITDSDGKDANVNTTELGQKMINALKNDVAGQSVLMSLDGAIESNNNMQRLIALEQGLRTAALKGGSDKTNFQKAADSVRAQINQISAKQIAENATNARKAAGMVVGGRNYAIELKYKNSDVGKAMKEALEKMQHIDIIQIPTLADMETAAAAMEGNDKTPDMQKLTMAMLNQTHNTSQMIEAKIEIVGDPYWLGQDNIEDIKKLMEKMEERANKQPNPIAASVMFLLELKFPEAYNEETGTMEFSSENLFKGLYNVIKATHKFSDGKFTQELTAYRELLTNMLTQSVDPTEAKPNQKPAEGVGKDGNKSTTNPPPKPSKPTKEDSPERIAQRKKYVEYMMTKKGPNGEYWTEEQAKGIVANLEKESRLNPTAVEEGKLSDKRMAAGGERGEGLAQWTSRGQKDALAQHAGYPPGTPIGQIPEEKQLDYLNYQLTTGNPKAGGYGELAAGKAMQKETTIAGATSTFTTKFERPANANGEAAARAQMAEAKYGTLNVTKV